MKEVKEIGHKYIGNGRCRFRVWAPLTNNIILLLKDKSKKRLFPLKKDRFGYWEIITKNTYPKEKYYYLVDGKKRPDPASFCQPEGVHKASEIIDLSSFNWDSKSWKNPPLKNYIIYELHIGAFTSKGDFYGAIKHLDRIKDTGINAVEIMPVSQFPGDRNWGYDGVFPFAVQNSYGGPAALLKFIDEAHVRKISVILDVVYNHLGPEGNYLNCYGPYFTNRYKTVWGDAINFDGSYSDEVRNYFIFNALYWFKYYHIDALRLDAVHSIYDNGSVHFLSELKQNIEKYNKDEGQNHYLITENDLNDSKVVKTENGGYGIDAQWNDDFHHSIHALMTGEKKGYYIDFGKLWHFKKTFSQGYVYGNAYSVFRKKTHGSISKGIPASKFVVFIQNHDQIGNRPQGERLTVLISFEALKVSVALMVLSPYIPLIFMGEEYAEDKPFLYFASHSDKDLIKSVINGRKEEFSSFNWEKSPPDPQDKKTFLNSKLDFSKLKQKKHKIANEYYKKIIALRKSDTLLNKLSNKHIKIEINEEKKIMVIHRGCGQKQILYLINFNNKPATISIDNGGKWEKLLDSSRKKWLGPEAMLPKIIKGNKNYNINGLNIGIYKKI